jgi:hypothetical protein
VQEADFATTSVADIVSHYIKNGGSILLRNFADPSSLLELRDVLDNVYDEVKGVHVFDHHLAERGLPDILDYIFSKKHQELLGFLYKGYTPQVYRTSARRVEPEGVDHVDRTWQQPLGPHLDATLHNFAFTLQFWVPLQPCGVDAPSLGVVCTDFDDVLQFGGYDGSPPARGRAGKWNYASFNALTREISGKSPNAMEVFRSHFADRIWTPSYNLGDAMMLSNWTYHFSHSAPSMQQRRRNVELRFMSSASLQQIREAHAAYQER